MALVVSVSSGWVSLEEGGLSLYLAMFQGGLSWPLINPRRGLPTHLSVYDVNLEQGRGAEGWGTMVLGLHL